MDVFVVVVILTKQTRR